MAINLTTVAISSHWILRYRILYIFFRVFSGPDQYFAQPVGRAVQQHLWRLVREERESLQAVLQRHQELLPRVSNCCYLCCCCCCCCCCCWYCCYCCCCFSFSFCFSCSCCCCCCCYHSCGCSCCCSCYVIAD